MTVLYIAGPMSGFVDFNYPQFDLAEKMLRGLWPARGNHIINPANNFNRNQGLTKEVYLRRAFGQVMASDYIYMLPAWETSKGATLEHDIASVLSLHITYFDDPRLYGKRDPFVQTVDEVAP